MIDARCVAGETKAMATCVSGTVAGCAIRLVGLQSTSAGTYIGHFETTGHADNVVVAVAGFPTDGPLKFVFIDDVHKAMASGVVPRFAILG
jgi:hypothetical protein